MTRFTPECPILSKLQICQPLCWRLPHSLRRNNFLVRPIQHDHGARTPQLHIYVSPIYCACTTARSSASGGTCLRRACVISRASSYGAYCCASSCSSNAYSANCTFCTSVHTCPGCSDVGGDNLKECVYLQEAWPQVQNWAADKKVCDMDCSSWSLFFPLPRVSEGALCWKVTLIWNRINLFSWSWIYWNRNRVDTHISCPCVCGVRVPAWFLYLTSNRLWLLFLTFLTVTTGMENNIFDSRQQNINSTNNSTLPLMMQLQSEPRSRIKLFKIVNPTFRVYIVVLCTENASNDTVTGLNWILGTDKMETYRTPARFQVFEWIFY